MKKLNIIELIGYGITLVFSGFVMYTLCAYIFFGVFDNDMTARAMMAVLPAFLFGFSTALYSMEKK